MLDKNYCKCVHCGELELISNCHAVTEFGKSALVCDVCWKVAFDEEYEKMHRWLCENGHLPYFPECEKHAETEKERVAITNFITFLSDKGITLGKWTEDGKWLDPAQYSLTELLAEHFGIDLNKLETERRELLKLAGGRYD